MSMAQRLEMAFEPDVIITKVKGNKYKLTSVKKISGFTFDGVIGTEEQIMKLFETLPESVCIEWRGVK